MEIAGELAMVVCAYNPGMNYRVCSQFKKKKSVEEIHLAAMTQALSRKLGGSA